MKEIVFSRERPAVYEKLKARFGADWDKAIIIASNGKIHSKDPITPQKVIHEKVHLEEQKKLGENVWWECYFESPGFRLEQEVKAYRAEVAFLKKYIKNREHTFHMVKELAKNLSSSVYGNLVTASEAYKLIT